VLEISAEENRRIGNDLHDGVGQELTGLSMIAGSLVIALSRKSMPEAKIAEKIDAGIKRALHQVRVLARGMNPVNVDTLGLMSSLSEMTSRLNELYGVHSTFECDEPVRFCNNQAATQLYRIAQEATTNAIKHGHARRLVISLNRRGEGALLSILDDGCGIPDESEPQQGMGLQTMEYRAGVVGGELRIAKRRGGGTKVTCTVPASALRKARE
jgi:signal transduction histidine kinase